MSPRLVLPIDTAAALEVLRAALRRRAKRRRQRQRRAKKVAKP